MAHTNKFLNHKNNQKKHRLVTNNDQIKILTRLNNSYELFRTFDMKRLIEVIRTGVCKQLEGETHKEFSLSSTDKMALNKALKEVVLKDNQKARENVEG